MTPDILRLIMDHCDTSTRAESARACWTWNGTALDALWRELPDVEPPLWLLTNFKPYAITTNVSI